jgi:hypothetical protein
MRRRALLLGFLLLAFAHADTLTLRNGTSVTGTWLDLDGEHVTFLVSNHVKIYPRSDVSGITFDAATQQTAMPPQGDFVPAPAPESTSAVIYPGIREPNTIGAVFMQDASGRLLALERNAPIERRNSPGVGSVFLPGARPTGNAARYWEIAGARSPARITQGEKPLFVVRVASGIDPASFSLYPLEVKKDARRIQNPPNNKNGLLTIVTTVTPFGESSYGLSPGGALPPGEYAFSPTGLKGAYCFGVDAVEPVK